MFYSDTIQEPLNYLLVYGGGSRKTELSFGMLTDRVAFEEVVGTIRDTQSCNKGIKDFGLQLNDSRIEGRFNRPAKIDYNDSAKELTLYSYMKGMPSAFGGNTMNLCAFMFDETGLVGVGHIPQDPTQKIEIVQPSQQERTRLLLENRDMLDYLKKLRPYDVGNLKAVGPYRYAAT